MNTDQLPIDNTRYRVAGATDPGTKREINEDAFLIRRCGPYVIAVVADGMGGHDDGARASKTVCEVFAEFCDSGQTADTGDWLPDESLFAAVNEMTGFQTALSQGKFQPPARWLAQLLQLANLRIVAGAAQLPTGHITGSTAAAVIVDTRGQHHQYFSAHVGDSRIYLLDPINRTLRRLTKDHTLTQSMADQGKISQDSVDSCEESSQLTRAVGLQPKVAVDVGHDGKGQPFEQGNVLLLCTDGLTKMAGTDRVLGSWLVTRRGLPTPEMLARQAISAGGLDNVTVITICRQLPEQPAADKAPPPKPPRKPAPVVEPPQRTAGDPPQRSIDPAAVKTELTSGSPSSTPTLPRRPPLRDVQDSPFAVSETDEGPITPFPSPRDPEEPPPLSRRFVHPEEPLPVARGLGSGPQQRPEAIVNKSIDPDGPQRWTWDDLPEATPSPPPVDQQPPGPVPEKKSRLPIILAGLVLVVALAAGGVAYRLGLFQQKHDGPAAIPSSASALSLVLEGAQLQVRDGSGKVVAQDTIIPADYLAIQTAYSSQFLNLPRSYAARGGDWILRQAIMEMKINAARTALSYKHASFPASSQWGFLNPNETATTATAEAVALVRAMREQTSEWPVPAILPANAFNELRQAYVHLATIAPGGDPSLADWAVCQWLQPGESVEFPLDCFKFQPNEPVIVNLGDAAVKNVINRLAGYISACPSLLLEIEVSGNIDNPRRLATAEQIGYQRGVNDGVSKRRASALRELIVELTGAAAGPRISAKGTGWDDLILSLEQLKASPELSAIESQVNRRVTIRLTRQGNTEQSAAPVAAEATHAESAPAVPAATRGTNE